MGTIATLAINIIGNIQGLDAALGRAQQSLNNMGASLTGIGSKMSLGITAPIVGIGAMALNSAGEFEQSMNVMQQVSGATAAQLATLQQQALDMGAATSFSAGEAAQAQLELAKAGLNVADIIAATPGVLDMAAASGMGLAESAEIAANAMNAFNLPASEMPAVANMLAAAANASSVDIDDLAMAMKMSGAVFASNKQPMDDMVTALAMLGNAGLKGSDAGTSLKTMMLSLAAPTDKAYGLLNDMGIAVYDNTGAMRGFSDILDDLSQATATMNDEQRNVALSTIFGSDAIRAATILTRDYGTSWDDISDALGNGSAAADIAAARMNGWRGAVEYLKGSLDSFLITAMLPFLNRMSWLLRLVADAITWLGQLPEPVRNTAIAIAAVAAAIGPALVGLGMLMKLAAFLTPVLSVLGAAVAALASPVGLVVAAVVALGIAWSTNFMGLRDMTMPIIDGIVAGFWRAIAAVQLFAASPTWTGLVKTVTDAMAEIGSAIQGFLSGDLSLPDLAGQLGNQLGKMTGAVQSALSSPDVAALGENLAKALGLDQINFDALRQGIQTFIEQFTASVTSFDWGGALGAAGGAFNSLKDTVVGAVTSIDWGGALATAGTYLDALKSAVVGAIAAVDWGGALTTAGTYLDSLKTAVVSAVTAIDWGGALATAGAFLDALKNAVVGAVTSIDWGGALTTAGAYLDSLKNTVVGAVVSIDWGGALTTAGAYLDALKNTVVSAVTSLDWGGALTTAGAYLDGLKNTVVSAVTSLDWGGALTTAGAYLDSLKNTVVGAVQGMDWSPVAAAMAPLATAVANAAVPLQEAQTAFTTFDFGAALTDLATNANTFRDDVLAKLTGVFLGLDLTAALTGMIDSMTTAVTTTDWSGVGSAVGSALATALDPENLKTAAVAMAALIAPAVTGAIAGITWVMSSENWAGFAASVKSSISNIDWGTVGASFTKLKTAISNALGEFASGLTEGFKTPAWLASLLAWKWPGLPEFGWPKLPGWKWPGLPKFGWPKLPGWKWPGLPKFEWPGTPAWVQGLIDALNSFRLPWQAVGTSYFGGGLVNVSEVSSEVAVLPRGVTWLPRGTQILNGRDSEAFMGGSGGGVTVVVQNANIRNERDLPRLASEVHDLYERRRR